uniref:HTH TFE/IIEalpha-type domain-containing protein n=1 Tax=Mesocestoides corti TaxID=53468 RepID=A0A5K3F0T6_MESCO
MEETYAVRNTIMKEDDLCERLRFEKKQLRQHLHTLKTDQFIKSKLQLETDAEGKIAKIIHYFIDYKLFVNIVKYRLDQMQRKLDDEQLKTSIRTRFRCLSCKNSYTDLEVDRLFDPTAGKLVCVYCRADVKEEEDNDQRSDARALVANFQQQVRLPLDALLKECDQVHLTSSILEPEFRALEPLPGAASDVNASTTGVRGPLGQDSWLNDPNKGAVGGAAGSVESTVIIVLDGNASTNTTVRKERPIWMSESTVSSGLGELDRGAATGNASGGSAKLDPTTQTLAPGRVPTSLHDTSNSTDGPQTSNQQNSSSSANNANVTSASDIMQLLRVHERRGLGSHGPKSALNRTPNNPASKASASSNFRNGQNGISSPAQNTALNHEATATPPRYVVNLGGTPTPYLDITPAMIKKMTPLERAEYVQVGQRLYSETVVD